MRKSIVIAEIQSRYKLLADRLGDVKLDLPMAYALLFKGIDALVKLRQNRSDIKDKVEMALNVAQPIAMPTGDQVVKLLGAVHDDKGER